jgi:nitrate/nitrite-specific signal transduction histidine kinase
VNVEGATRDLAPILRDEVYRIAAEALRNSFRHACARRIEVEIHYDQRQFRLRVKGHRQAGAGRGRARRSGRNWPAVNWLSGANSVPARRSS